MNVSVSVLVRARVFSRLRLCLGSVATSLTDLRCDGGGGGWDAAGAGFARGRRSVEEASRRRRRFSLFFYCARVPFYSGAALSRLNRDARAAILAVSPVGRPTPRVAPQCACRGGASRRPALVCVCVCLCQCSLVCLCFDFALEDVDQRLKGEGHQGPPTARSQQATDLETGETAAAAAAAAAARAPSRRSVAIMAAVAAAAAAVAFSGAGGAAVFIGLPFDTPFGSLFSRFGVCHLRRAAASVVATRGGPMATPPTGGCHHRGAPPFLLRRPPGFVSPLFVGGRWRKRLRSPQDITDSSSCDLHRQRVSRPDWLASTPLCVTEFYRVLRWRRALTFPAAAPTAGSPHRCRLVQSAVASE